ncbi:hypothetical protein N7537_009113 [Penicillium hordei]|uniref:Uncharacterized protein n=1 Tax=Penicillium hordei TaxID=40994 RepID=A0AAD6DTM6_9EURO|nr:uncharacterized protein N7537_009113 [Penicillium hordei]KAJ5592209.1 hypothetical protein N7537_009113 [Penicillium hordei]
MATTADVLVNEFKSLELEETSKALFNPLLEHTPAIETSPPEETSKPLFNPFLEYTRALETMEPEETSKALNPFFEHVPAPGTLEELLKETIKHANIKRILPNDPIFTQAAKLRDKYGLPQQGFENFRRLLCGIVNFPCILFQNPKNDKLEFDKMVTETFTLDWLQVVLGDTGFKLDDIIIMELFPMLTDTWLENNHDKRLQALHDMFELTLACIHKFKLPVIVACQCFSPKDGGLYDSFWHAKLGDLRSSLNGAKNQTVSQFNYKQHIAHVVHGFHPAYGAYQNTEYRKNMMAILRSTFNSLFGSYAESRREYEATLLLLESRYSEFIRSSIETLHGKAIEFDQIHKQGLALDLFQGHDDSNILDSWNELKSTLDLVLNKLSPTAPRKLLL